MAEGTPGRPSRIDQRVSPEAADALAAIVMSASDAIYSKDRNATITSWNPAAERLYGYTAEEAVGAPIAMLIPEDRRGEETDFLERILQGESIDHYETERRRKDGSVVRVSVSISPVHNAAGEIVEAAVVARDVTAQRELEATVAARSRKQALELNDEVVQGLATAKLALESGRHEQGLKAIESTLDRVRAIVTALLAEAGKPIQPGDLLRDVPAQVAPPDPQEV